MLCFLLPSPPAAGGGLSWHGPKVRAAPLPGRRPLRTVSKLTDPHGSVWLPTSGRGQTSLPRPIGVAACRPGVDPVAYPLAGCTPVDRRCLVGSPQPGLRWRPADRSAWPEISGPTARPGLRPGLWLSCLRSPVGSPAWQARTVPPPPFGKRGGRTPPRQQEEPLWRPTNN
jgi:hypothetical protein